MIMSLPLPYALPEVPYVRLALRIAHPTAVFVC